MKAEKDNKGTTITFRTNEQLKKKLETLAAKESRSLSNFIEVVLETATKDKR